MKNKIHLFYGIIIGILLFACVGGTSETESESDSTESTASQESNRGDDIVVTDTATPTSSASPTKMEVKMMFGSDDHFDEDTSLYQSALYWASSDRDFGNTGRSSMTRMYDEGWRIVEVVKTNSSAETSQLLVIFEREVKE